MADLKMLAIDLGASSGRGIIGGFDGKKFTLEENHRFPNEPVNINGDFCWDIMRIFHEIKKAILKCSLSDDAGVKNIKSIGIDTWGVDYGFLDKRGALLANPYHYRDTRTDDIQDYVFKTVSYSDLYDITGIQSMNFNSIYQLAADLRDRPWIVECADKMMFIPDLLGYFLTGEKRNEYTIASTGAILDAKTGKIAYDLLDKLGIPRRLFGELSQPGTVIGPLLPSLKEELGGVNANLVNIASHDTASAVISVPAKGEDFIYISSGTWSLMGVESKTPIINEGSKKYSFTNEGGADGTIRFLKNIMGLWLEQESKRQWEREGLTVSFDELTKLALEAKAFASLIDPDDASFSPPGNMPRRIAAYCKESGQSVIPESIGQTVRCIFESLALKYRATIEKIQEITGKKYTSINIVGGGTKEAILCQWTANACGIPVYAGPVEATAIGNIAMQAVAAGEISGISQAREVIRNSFDIVTYEPQDVEAWNDAYVKFKEIVKK